MSGFIKKIFNTLLVFGESVAAKCVSLNNQYV